MRAAVSSAVPGPAPTTAAPPGGNQRWDYLDQLRTLLMLYGIPYHAGLIYAVHAPWIVNSPDQSALITWMLQFTHTFRMPVFFLLAGFFGMLVIGRRGEVAWWKGRLWRLGVPLLTSLVLVSPFMVMASAVAQGGWDNAIPGLLRAMRNPGADWTVHLWFLIYLLPYCAGLALLWRYRAALRLEAGLRRFQDAVERWPLLGWMALLILGGMTVAAATAAKLADASYMLGGILVPAQFIADGLVFLCGALLAYRRSWLEAFTRPCWPVWGLALAAAVAMAVFEARDSNIARAITYFLMPVVGVLFAHLLLSASRRWLDRSTRLSRAMVDAAMTMYLVHVAFVLWLAVAFLAVPLPALVEFALIIVLAGAASYAFHGLVRRSGLLTLLFTGQPAAPSRHAGRVPA